MSDIAAIEASHQPYDDIVEWRVPYAGEGTPAWNDSASRERGDPPVGAWVVVGHRATPRCLADDHGEGTAWPCDTRQVLDALRAAEAREARLRRTMQGIADEPGVPVGIRTRARAALASTEEPQP